MRVEEQYPDVCQNIEFGIVMTYRDRPHLTDAQVIRALEALIDAYVAEKIGREPRVTGLSRDEQAIVQNMREMCEWRLGRSTLSQADKGELIAPEEPHALDVIILCLKRILKSVRRWNREFGMRGYLEFIVQFIR